MRAKHDRAADGERDRAESALDELANLAAIIFVASERVGCRVDDDEARLQVERSRLDLRMESGELADALVAEGHQYVVFAKAREPMHAVGSAGDVVAAVDRPLPSPKFIVLVFAIDAEAHGFVDGQSEPK